MAKFSRFKPTRDAFLFGWSVLGEDFLGPSQPAPVTQWLEFHPALAMFDRPEPELTA